MGIEIVTCKASAVRAESCTYLDYCPIFGLLSNLMQCDICSLNLDAFSVPACTHPCLRFCQSYASPSSRAQKLFILLCLNHSSETPWCIHRPTYWEHTLFVSLTSSAHLSFQKFVAKICCKFPGRDVSIIKMILSILESARRHARHPLHSRSLISIA